MLELTGTLVLVGLLLALLVIVAAPIVLAVVVLAAVLRIVLAILLLPFRILGWGVGLGFAAIGLLLKGLLLAFAVALVLVVGLVPLVPIVLIGGIVYFLVRSGRPRAVPAA
jgi:hypothetical protein